MDKFGTKYTGVRYREHPTRKTRNGQADRYYTIRYKIQGVLYEERLGWASEGWTAERAYAIRSTLKSNITTGTGPQTLAAMREDEQQRLQSKEQDKIKQSLDAFTFGEYLDNYFLPYAKENKRSWRDDALRIAKHILPALGHIPIRALASQDIKRLMDSMSQAGYANATIRQVFAIIRRACNMAASSTLHDEIILTKANPCKGIPLPKVINARDRYLSREEADALVRAASARPDQDLHDAIILSLYAGLRLGEILRLQWMDINFTQGILTVREEDKRKPGGKVPLNSTILLMLTRRREATSSSDSCLVFPPLRGGKGHDNMRRPFQRLIDQLGLNDSVEKTDRQRRVVFHTLRHTFASWLAINGTDIYRIKTLMRHKTIDMTMRYAHLIPDATREAVDQLKPPDYGNPAEE